MSNTFTVNGHTYKVLGASGLIKDENGDFLEPSEIEALFPKTEKEKKIDTSFSGFGVSGELDKKTNPSHWYYDYDPRYCGPSREEYMEEMARKYREKKANGET